MEITELDKIWNQTVDAVAAELIVERWRIEEAFAYGSCHKLALALHESLGLPIFIAATQGTYTHAFCAVSAERGLDIWGVRPFRTIRSVWAESDPDVELLGIDPADLRAMGGREPEPLFALVPQMICNHLSVALMKDGFERVRAPGQF